MNSTNKGIEIDRADCFFVIDDEKIISKLLEKNQDQWETISFFGIFTDDEKRTATQAIQKNKLTNQERHLFDASGPISVPGKFIFDKCKKMHLKLSYTFAQINASTNENEWETLSFFGISTDGKNRIAKQATQKNKVTNQERHLFNASGPSVPGKIIFDKCEKIHLQLIV